MNVKNFKKEKRMIVPVRIDCHDYEKVQVRSIHDITFDLPDYGVTVDEHGLKKLHMNFLEDGKTLIRQCHVDVFYGDGEHKYTLWTPSSEKNDAAYADLLKQFSEKGYVEIGEEWTSGKES